jgi:hypothetical protein
MSRSLFARSAAPGGSARASEIRQSIVDMPVVDT